MVACADRSTTSLCRVDQPRRDGVVRASAATGVAGVRVVHSWSAGGTAAVLADVILKPEGAAAAAVSLSSLSTGSAAPTTSASTGAAGATPFASRITKPSLSGRAGTEPSARERGAAVGCAGPRATGAGGGLIEGRAATKPRSGLGASAGRSRPRSWTANVNSSSSVPLTRLSPLRSGGSVGMCSPCEFGRPIVRAHLFAAGKDRVADRFPLVVTAAARERIP